MSRINILRAFVNQRLTVAVEEIIGLFERTITDYQEEIDRQRRLLEDVAKPGIQINTAALSPDVHQLIVDEEEVLPEQQQRSPSLDQEDQEPPHIKEEQEELWTIQEGEQLQGLEETDITTFPFTPVPVKSEDDVEEPQSSQLHQSQSGENRQSEPLASTSTEQMTIEADGDWGGSEPASNLDAASDLQPTSDDQLLSSHCSEPEPETEDRDDDWKETREPPSDLNSIKSKKRREEKRVEEKCLSVSTKFRRKMPYCSVEMSRVLVKQQLLAADITKFPFTPVPVKSKDDVEEPQSSQLHQSQSEENRESEPLASTSTDQMKPEADGDCGGPEPASNLDPVSDLQPTSAYQLLSSNCSEPETEDRDDDRKETREPPSDLNSIKSRKRREEKRVEEKCLSVSTKFRRKMSYCSVEMSRVLVKQQLLAADITKFPFTPVPVKSDGDEEEPQSSQLLQSQSEENRETEPLASTSTDQMKPEADGDCGGSIDLNLANFLQACNDGRFLFSHCFKTVTEDVDPQCLQNWKETREPQSGLGKLTKSDVFVRRTRSHTGERRCSCSVCGKTFRHNGILQRHMRCHTGEKPFDCPNCGKKFRQKGSLQTHMRHHTGEKPFSCLVCGTRFSQSGTLASHMRIHTGEKPFSCSVCKNSYSEKGGLVRHMRVHTGEKPFSCSVCSKSFSEKGNLNKHMRVHTGEEHVTRHTRQKP